MRLLVFASPLGWMLGLLIAMGSSSCVMRRDLVAFRSTPQQQASAWMEPVVQRGDILHIVVHSSEAEAVAPFNWQGFSEANPLSAAQPQMVEIFLGYLVNGEGNIDFPLLGAVPVAGLTLSQVKDTLEARLKTYVRDVVVQVRFINFRITVLGEVNQPGTYTITSPRITLLEALGRAGDLSPYANRTNILHIREQNGQRIFTRINLQTDQLFSSPVYYLQQNDIIYVEPGRSKVAAVADPATRIVTYTTGILSVVTFLIALFRK